MFQNFYHGLTRKYVVYFGNLFNNIVITRTDATGATAQSIKVPLSYAPKDKVLARVIQDPDLTKEDAITLPAMSFVYHSYVYDANRAKNTLGGIARKIDTNPSKFNWQYNPVPVDLAFTLYVYVKYQEDGTKIIEQILPYFRPDWTANLVLVPEMDISMKIPLILEKCTNEYSFEGALKDRPILIWTLDFVMKGYLFGPVRKQPIIQITDTNLRVGDVSDNPDVISSVEVSPGMLANGSPTSNAALSVDPKTIYVDDDWNDAITYSGLIITE